MSQDNMRLRELRVRERNALCVAVAYIHIYVYKSTPEPLMKQQCMAEQQVEA